MPSQVAAADWSASPLGPMELWPVALRTLVGVIMGANQPMFVAWGAGHTLIYNDAYAQILADKHPAALGRPFLEVWPEIRGDLTPIVEQAYAGEPVHMDDIALMMHRRGVAEEAHFAFSYTPVFGDGGDVQGLFCACIEITEQVMAGRRRAEETARQRRLFEQAPGFITILRSPGHTFEFVNDAYCRLFGYRDYVGRNARDVFPELEGQGFFELLDRVWETQQRVIVRDQRARVADPAGGLRDLYLDFIYEPVVDEHGAITGIFCEGYDVTETKRTQAALAESEERLRTALEIQTVGAIRFDMAGRLLDANDAFLRMTGYDREDVERGALTWQTLTPEDWLAQSYRAFEELQESGETTPYEKEYLRKDGTRMWSLFAAKLLGDGTGFEFVLDITDRKRAEERLELLVMELNHRVKNNLATVQSLARQTLTPGLDPAQAREAFLDRLHAMAVAHDLLTREQWDGVRLDELAKGVVGPLAGERRLILEGASLRVRPQVALSLSMAFHELATNALKYGALSRPGGQVRIAWTLDSEAEPRARLTWAESGGPKVSPPTHRGFGSRLLERGLAADLSGPVVIDFAPQGVHAVLRVPIVGT